MEIIYVTIPFNNLQITVLNCVSLLKTKINKKSMYKATIQDVSNVSKHLNNNSKLCAVYVHLC